MTLTSIMEKVVEEGTGRTFAQIQGYTVAGKTGTSHKLINGRYSQSDYYASFVGFLPSRNPVVTIIVVLDSPHAVGYYGGPISGPIFQKIAQAALRHFGVAPSINAPPPVLVARQTDYQEFQPAQSRDVATVVPAGRFDGPQGLPDLRGLGAREALRVLTKIGLSARLNGSGVVTSQMPVAGTPVDPGVTCELWLERAAVTMAAPLGDAP